MHNHAGITARHRQTGFTMVELVVAITLSAIVAGFVALFIATPVQAYLAQERRATLNHQAEISLLNLGDDIRSALPNSARYSQSGSILAIELWPVVAVASYRDSGSAGSAIHELDFIAADNQFSNYAAFATLSYPFISTQHHLVINNLGMPGADAYELSNVITPATSIRIDNGMSASFTPALSANEDHVTLGSGFHFASASPSHHVYLVSTPVTYICDTSQRTLTRYANYPINSSLSAAIPGGTGALIANEVASCSISCVPGSGRCGKLVTLNLIFGKDGETLNVMQQTALDYQP
jgi:MSHA biogenesis protein MshO